MNNEVFSSLLLVTMALASLAGCAAENNADGSDTTRYLQKLEQQNNIDYDTIQNTRGAYITSMCYTQTKETDGSLHNPCYSCHSKGREPNYYNDSTLQKEYSFPPTQLKNPFGNLFKDRSAAVANISDQSILDYVRRSNYFNQQGEIALALNLPDDWQGYRPDIYFNFDSAGFDRSPAGDYTGWRAFRYYPFLGTFWPTNGSADDVMIRLDAAFMQDDSGVFDTDIYRLNLSIVEALVKQKTIILEQSVDETRFAVDLNQNGQLDRAQTIKIAAPGKMSYVGRAKRLLQQGKLHLAAGLFPENSEFLHSVRYLDRDENSGKVQMAARMKELRYARKYGWKTYSELQRIASAELYEAQANDADQGVLATFRGNFEQGMKNEQGWVYQGFIEDRQGALRPQTQEETLYCMGCHSHLGATTDSIFSFARKLEGVDQDDVLYGWNHWSQKGLAGIPEPKVNYLKAGEQYEYSFYLKNNHSGNEFRNNAEIEARFFDADGNINPQALDALHDDIAQLLLPSSERALLLNKGYRVMVEEQSFIHGRDANIAPMQHVLREVAPEAPTGIEQVIVRE